MWLLLKDCLCIFFYFLFIYFLSFIIFTFTYMCIHGLDHFPTPPTPSTPTSAQNLFHPLVLQFCWRENIGENKTDISLLLVGDKDSYTERFLALLPCTCVLQLTLLNLCQTSSLLLGHLPIVASANLRLLYSLLNRAHQPHSRFRFPLLSLFLLCMFSP
jgi:hypothetical protein